MYFEAVHSKHTLGREYWLVVHLENIATPLATSPTMLRRVQPDDNVDLLVDLHTLGINVTMGTGKAIIVTVQHLSFKLDCTRGVELVEDPAMRFQLQVDIKKLMEHEFAVQVIVGTDENDTPAVREVMDLICEGVDAIEIGYPEDERESLNSHEKLKILALRPALFDRYSVMCKTTTQQEAVDTWGRLIQENDQKRNIASNGWTIPLPLSEACCDTLRSGIQKGEIEIKEKGTPAQILERRLSRGRALHQLRESVSEG